MPSEILDIVVRQRGARKVARDIGTIGVAATSSRNALRGLQTSLNRTQQAMNKAKGATTAATGALRGLGAAGVGAKRSLTALGTGVALVGGAITAALVKPLKGAINAAADFEQAMNLTGVLTRVDRVSTAFADMEAKAKDLGLTTQFTATQAAEGMQFLAKAGFEAQQVIDAIEPSLNLAAAANVGMAEAADMATNIIKGYRQEVEDLPRSIDILASAFTSSNTDIQELSKAFRDAGPIAVEFGQRFEDVASIISALADAGIKSQKAGIALRRIMINLQKDASKSTSVLRELGISIVEVGTDGVERFRPLQDIFIDIANSSATGTQKIDLFGARALAAAGILNNSADSLERFADSIANDVGRAAEVGAARLKGFRGAMTLLNSALEGLGIAIAESGLLDFLIGLIKSVTGFVRAMADLPKPIKSVLGAMLAFTAVVSALLLKIGLLIVAIAVLKSAGFPGFIAVIGRATTALKAFSVALLTTPVGLVVVAIAALIGILFALRNETIVWGDQVFTIGDLVVATWDTIVEAVTFAWDWWGKFFSDTIAGLGDWKDSLKTTLRFVQAFLNAVIAIPIVVGRVILSAFNLVAKPLAAFISGVVDAIRDIPKLVKGAFTGEDILGSITKPFVDAYNEVKIEGEDLVNDLGDILTFDYLGEAGKGVLTLLDAFDITDKAHARFLERLKKRQAAARPEAPGAGDAGRPPPGTTLPPGLGEEEIKARSEAYVDLVKSMLDLTSAEERLREAEITLRKAVEAGVVSAENANRVYQYLASQVFRDLENALFPVNEALKDQADQLRELNTAAEAAGISSERLAKAQAKVRENFEKSLVAMEDYQESLSSAEALQAGVVEGINQFGESLGTAFSNIADLVEGVMDKSMDAIHEFVTTGKFNFREFALSVIADIQKVILKLLALQVIGAFKNRDEFGGGISGFFGGLAKGDFTGFDRFGIPGAEEKAAEIAGQATEMGTQTNPLYMLGANSPDHPLATTLTDPEAPGIVSLRDAFTTSIKKANTLNIEKVTETNSILDSMLTQLQTMSTGGIGGLGSEAATDAINAGTEATVGGLGDVIHNGQTNAEQMQDAIGRGSGDTISEIGKSGREIVSAIVAGRGGKGSTAFNIVSLALKLVGGLMGGAGGAAAGAGGSVIGAAGSAGNANYLSTATDFTGGGFAKGGTIPSGQARNAFLVGERGPELFSPGRAGTVFPNNMLEMMSQPPEIKLQVVNVDDPTSIPEAMGTREGEKAVLNVIQRNRGRLREILA
jgi:TP901 family phage tail tape measure protein